MKQILSLIFVFASIYIAHAQLGIEGSYMVPTGEFAYLMKPTYGAEIRYNGVDIDDRFKFGFSFGYYRMRPTQDTFHTYGLGNNIVLPGYEAVKSYDETPIGLTTEFKVLKTKLSPVIGIDLYFTVIGIDEDAYLATVSDVNGNDTYFLLTYAPKIGFCYQANDYILLHAMLARSLTITGSVDGQKMWKSSVGFTYYFD